MSQSTNTHHLPISTDIAGPSEVRLLPSDRACRTLALLREAYGADEHVARQLHEQVIMLNVEVADSVVMRYRNRGVPNDDLIQVGRLGLVKAAQGFDPHKSDNFLGYAVPTILGEVKRFFRDNAWVIKPPRRVQELQAELAAVTARLTHDHGGIAPSVAELAAECDVDEAAVREALSSNGCFAPTSLDQPTQDDSGPGTTLGETMGSPDRGFDRSEAVVALAPICRTLSDRDRRIVYLRFYQEWTQSRIAEELGVTQMQVSRLLARILSGLREQLGDIGDPEYAPTRSG